MYDCVASRFIHAWEVESSLCTSLAPFLRDEVSRNIVYGVARADDEFKGGFSVGAVIGLARMA